MSGKGEKSSDTTETVIGCAALIVMAVIGYFVFAFIYEKVNPTSEVEIALRLEFNATEGMVVRGDAYLRGKPVSEGIVALDISRIKPATRQTLITSISKGGFESGWLPGFLPSEQIRVEATATVPQESEEEPATGQANAMQNLGRSAALFVGVIVAILLCGLALVLTLFTGKYSYTKHRIAISVSYLCAAFFLVAPLLVLLVVPLFPGIHQWMAESPVGLLKVNCVSPEALNEACIHQWAVHIGGIPESPAHAGSIEGSPGQAAETEAGGQQQAPSEPGEGESAPQPADESAAVTRAQASAQPVASDLYDIRGGLVIPMYVLILATLGGAVNMTRRIPDLQRQIAAKFELEHWFGIKGLRKLGQAVKEAFQEVEDLGGARRIDEVQQAVLPEEREDFLSFLPVLRQVSHQDALNKLRGDLINQYMYLITAPVLAIVTYYLLFMIQVKVIESVPLVVLMSFSSGLISEAFLRAIISRADGVLSRAAAREESKAGAAAAPPPPAAAPEPEDREVEEALAAEVQEPEADKDEGEPVPGRAEAESEVEAAPEEAEPPPAQPDEEPGEERRE